MLKKQILSKFREKINGEFNMKTSINKRTKEILKEIEEMPEEKFQEVLNFICFLKVKDVIEPEQMYFWTKEWQDMEKEAELDKEKGNIIGDGTITDLLKKLKK